MVEDVEARNEKTNINNNGSGRPDNARSDLGEPYRPR